MYAECTVNICLLQAEMCIAFQSICLFVANDSIVESFNGFESLCIHMLSFPAPTTTSSGINMEVNAHLHIFPEFRSFRME